MIRSMIILSLGLIFITVTNPVIATPQDSLIQYGIEQSILQNYATAESLFAVMIKQEPDNPGAYFFLAAIIQSKMMDYETDQWEDKFLDLIQQTERTAQTLIEKQPTNAWAYFFLGSAFSYHAFYDGRTKSYVSAVKHARTGIQALEKAIELDSTMYDAYFGLGSYKYWRSKMTRYINWLPILKDERKKGISLVKKAAAKGRFTRYAAVNELTWILIDDGQVSEALRWASIGSEQYPHSRFFMWGKAKCHFNLQQYEEAKAIYKQILQSVLNDSINNYYNETICYYKLADCDYHLESYDAALHHCDQISSLQLAPDIRKRLKDILEKVDDLQKAIAKKMLADNSKEGI